LKLFLNILFVASLLYVFFVYEELGRLYEFGLGWFVRRLLAFVVGFAVVTTFAVRSSIQFEKDFVYRQDITGWLCFIGVLSLYLALAIRKVCLYAGLGISFDPIVSLMMIGFPAMTVVWRVCALIAARIGSGLELFDFISAGASTFFLMFMRKPLVDEGRGVDLEEPLRDGAAGLMV
jgi:hypothetical protein